MSLYDDVLELGVEHSNHHSDLYIPKNAVTTALLEKHGLVKLATTFKDNITGATWYDVAFQYEPWYKKRG